MDENKIMDEVMENVVEETTEQLPEVAENVITQVDLPSVGIHEIEPEVPTVGIGKVIAVGVVSVAAGALAYQGVTVLVKKIKEKLAERKKYAKVKDEDDVAEEEAFDDEELDAEPVEEKNESTEK